MRTLPVLWLSQEWAAVTHRIPYSSQTGPVHGSSHPALRTTSLWNLRRPLIIWHWLKYKLQTLVPSQYHEKLMHNLFIMLFISFTSWISTCIPNHLRIAKYRVHLYCSSCCKKSVSWCQSPLILMKMRYTQPLEVTSSQPLTQVAILQSFQPFECFIGQHFRGKFHHCLSQMPLVLSAWQTHTNGCAILCLFMIVVVHLTGISQ